MVGVGKGYSALDAQKISWNFRNLGVLGGEVAERVRVEKAARAKKGGRGNRGDRCR